MPEKVFLELKEEKQGKIVNVSIAEFAEYGYENSSTNRIVQNAGISKGSLFKYFRNKEELYFYILDYAVGELIGSLEKEIAKLPGGMFERVLKYSELEFAWYMEHPDICRLLTAAFTKDDTVLYRKVEKRYGVKERDIFDRLFEHIDVSFLKWDKKKTADILRWFLKGFNDEFRVGIRRQKVNDIDNLRKQYVSSLTEYLEILKTGMISKG